MGETFKGFLDEVLERKIVSAKFLFTADFTEVLANCITAAWASILLKSIRVVSSVFTNYDFSSHREVFPSKINNTFCKSNRIGFGTAIL